MINNIAQNIALKIRPFQIKIELVLFSFIIIGVVLKGSSIGNILLVVSFNTLCILYFIMAFRINKPATPTSIFLNRLIQLSFSVASLAILFTIQHYPGAAMMMRLSMVSMFIGFIFLVITKLKNKEQIIDPDIIRLVIFTLLVTVLITSGSFEEFQSKDINHQELIENN